jgi:hypothetical protein
MGKAISTQHPAVVLRSQYRNLRTLLVIAMIAVVGLTAAVVILAIDDDGVGTSLGSAPIAANPTGAARSDGGPEESAVAASVGAQPTVAGPNESHVAAAIGSGGGTTATGGPDESVVAGAVSGR